MSDREDIRYEIMCDKNAYNPWADLSGNGEEEEDGDPYREADFIEAD